MPFAYYNRLSAADKRTYRRSDEIVSVPLPGAESLRSLPPRLELALKAEDPVLARTVATQLLKGMTAALKTPPVRIEVLAVRPHDSRGELHGLYTPAEDETVAAIQVWMRTARHKRVVAFRSFLRTILHEFCHHLDYEYFGLDDSFHTEGFYKRESNLFRQLMGEAQSPPNRRR
jgi:hypothetical protein